VRHRGATPSCRTVSGDRIGLIARRALRAFGNLHHLCFVLFLLCRKLRQLKLGQRTFGTVMLTVPPLRLWNLYNTVTKTSSGLVAMCR
jgi:hypothetical protein